MKKIIFLSSCVIFNVCFADPPPLGPCPNIEVYATIHNNSNEGIWYSSEENQKTYIAARSTLPYKFMTGHNSCSLQTTVHLWQDNDSPSPFCVLNYETNNIDQMENSWSDLIQSPGEYEVDAWNNLNHSSDYTTFSYNDNIFELLSVPNNSLHCSFPAVGDGDELEQTGLVWNLEDQDLLQIHIRMNSVIEVN